MSVRVQQCSTEMTGNPIAPSVENFNEGGAREFLSEYKWPIGLQDTFLKNLRKAAYRFYICDDSGSMGTNDGHLIVGGPNDPNKSLIKASRWAEMTTAVTFLASLAKSTSSPTQFRLLNNGSPLVIGSSEPGDAARHQQFLNLLSGSPGGGTPLCKHITAIANEIQNIAPQLRAAGQKALIVIFTDGQASDGNVAVALRPLQDLPVWVAIRMCTDEGPVMEYWDAVDKEIEVQMDVLDDLCGEAKAIHTHNKFLTYGEPLQRLREFGCSVMEFDVLDERKLSPEQVGKVCSAIFGGSLPHPEVDWNGFIAAVTAANASAPPVWNPVTRKMDVWVNTAHLHAAYKTDIAQHKVENKQSSGCCGCIIA